MSKAIHDAAVKIFYGNDDYVVETRCQQWLDSIEKHYGDCEVNAYSAEAFTAEDALILAASQSLLGDKRVYLLKNPGFLMPGQGTKGKQKTNPGDKAWTDYVENPNPDSLLVITLLIEKKPSGLLKKTLDKGVGSLCDKPDVKTLYALLDEKAKDHGKKWSPEAKAILQDLHRYLPTGQLMQEAEKALLYSDHIEVNAQGLSTVLSPVAQLGIFNLLDAIMEGQNEKAISAWQDCYASGETPSKVIYMIGDALKRILMVQWQKEKGMSVQHIQESIGRPAFVIKKDLRQGSRITSQRILSALDYLLEEDFRRKRVSGIQDYRFIEELIVVLIYKLHHKGFDRRQEVRV